MEQPEIRDLLRRCVAGGDESAWRRFLDEFEPAMRLGIRRALRRAAVPADPWMRDELLQEVYCRLLARRCRILRSCRCDEAPAVAAYLMRVAENVSFDRLRALGAAKRGRGRMVRLGDGERLWRDAGFVAEGRGPEGRLLARERRRRAFARCRPYVGGRTPRRDLKVLFLAYCHGLSSAEIARRLGGGLTASRVDSLMHRLRRRLARGGIRIPRRE